MAFSSENAGFSLGRVIRNNRTALIIGGLIGLMSGGLFGLVFGAGIAVALSSLLKNALGNALNPQDAFFRATFTVMGKLAKADGRVSEEEIQYAREVMNRMGLSDERRREAMELFSQGKASDFDIAEVMRPLSALIRFRIPLKLMFVEIQLQAAMADGQVSEAETIIIREVCQLLQMSQAEMAALMARMQSQFSYQQHSYQSHQGGYVSEQELLKESYGVLGVAESVSDAELKKAYRRLISQHHPDKLVAKGLPEDMMQLAKEKTQEIQAAYDRIREARKNS
ncbi:MULTISPECIES: co-chaperone DjlA [Amphritea]|uniref:DnaJ like chaperone protein n=2 Tax=Amphritea TaxID=515417 RepID=A0A1H9M9A3_9GAMM|nr:MULTISPECIES: co-chaperone DjlA [Amphritea]MBN0986900.1 co-chaperone DjlA [Amphritea pacifica]MBN1005353.1 co-chaperone DjlA [Amphritea pacifica]SER19713.1 DnaJ like chaperone protein [Amphritea atlantica]